MLQQEQRKKMHTTVENAAESEMYSFENIRHTYSILRNVAEDYICLIEVDLSSGKEIRFQLDQDRGNGRLPSWSEADDYAKAITDYANLLIVPEDRERFLNSTRMDELMNVLTHQKEFVIEYDVSIASELHRFQGRFTLGEGDAHMYIGIRDITETRKYEAQSKEISEFGYYRGMRGQGNSIKHTILVMEDNQINREILSEGLSDIYHLIHARDGQEGLSLLSTYYDRVSLILLDVVMPHMDGFEVLRVLKENPLYRHIPVIMTTGSKSKGMEAECLRMGATDYVQKPYDFAILKGRISSILKLRESAAELARVEYDDLTGVYTRQAFFHHAEMLLRLNPNEHYSVVVSDIENFRSINEQYGEPMANEVLKVNAEHLLHQRHCLLSGRLSGDQFVSIIPYTPQRRENINLDGIAARLCADFPVPNLSIKFGIYEDVPHTMAPNILCDRAVLALRTVKHKYGSVSAKYNSMLEKRLEDERRLESQMRDAYNGEQFLVYYQPKHAAKDGRLLGAEALIRWMHPEKGMLSPGQFIPLFERTGFITWADHYVWKHVCQDLRQWMNEGISIVPISINITRQDLLHEEFASKGESVSRHHGIPPEYLHVEVTETLFTEDGPHILEMLSLCRSRGHLVELDDFGKGYSTMNALSEMPLDVVKLDMAFIRQLNDTRKRKVLSSCISLARDLGMHTVIEGVETEEQRKMVTALGVDMIQGYYYAKPMPAFEFREYLKKHLS